MMGDLGKKLPKVQKSPDLVTLVMFTFDRSALVAKFCALAKFPLGLRIRSLSRMS